MYLKFLLLFTALPLLALADLPYSVDFADGAAGWTATGQAELSAFSPLTDGQSLVIRQWSDEHQDSQWLSPPLPNPGKPVAITFWAADNYLKQPDFTYAAVVDAIDYDADGKEKATTWYLQSIPWDDSRKSSMWGQLLPEGLVWKRYRVVHRPRGETFRLVFHWRKPIVRGECYLTDLKVEPTDETIAGQTTEDAKAPTVELEISTPVYGNLFYSDEPLRFEFLAYGADRQKLPELQAPEIRWSVTDFQRLQLASGRFAFEPAAPVEDPAFYKTRAGRARPHNLLHAQIFEQPELAPTSRELFIEATLFSGGQALATDTVTYAVLEPFRATELDKSHFSMSKFHQFHRYTESPHERQSIADRLGISWTQNYDYWWIRVQPTYPGPYDFGEPLPAFPKLTFCPNLEQMRAHPERLRDFVPPACIIEDPLRPGKLTFKIDPYVEYIVAYIEHNRQAIARVVPSGLERQIDARTVELHRKAYAAIKARWPDLPVGFMLYGLPMNPSKDVDIFLENKLYECTDFLDTHVYASSVDWSEWERLQRAYRKLGLEPPPLYSTEFSKVGGMEQVARSRDMIAAHLDAIANGMSHIYYYNTTNTTGWLPDPFLRGPTDLGGDMNSGFLFMQWIDRPKVSTALEFLREERFRWGQLIYSHMPLLQTTTYASLIRHLEGADYETTFRPADKLIGYRFGRDNETICALWLEEALAPRLLAAETTSPVQLQDLFGRRWQVEPLDGKIYLTIDQNPVWLTFAGDLEPTFTVVDGHFTVPAIARGSKGQAAVHLPLAADLTVRPTLDATWPAVDPVQLAGGNGTIEVAVNETRRKADYPLIATLESGGKTVGVLRTTLTVDEILRLHVSDQPDPPAVVVDIESLADQTMTGSLHLADHAFRGLQREQRYTVAAGETTRLTFPIPAGQVNRSTSYTVGIDLRDDSGISLQTSAEVAFRQTARARQPITIDGKLDDWDLEALSPIPFARAFTVWGKPHQGEADISGRMYSRWDDQHLYFAVVAKDDSAVVRANTISIWQDDNIMLGLYPWGWQHGETLQSGYYREHLGPCADGVDRIFRVGNVAVGPTRAEGARLAVTRTDDGWIYEWAYPQASLAPLQLAPGSRFRLSLFLMDRDRLPDNELSKLGGIQLGGFNENVDARPVKWREFVLTP